MGNALNALRELLLALPATGADGFEGLIRAALYEITGVPLRLAKSGSQRGVDGESTYSEDYVCFEAKRYSGQVPYKEVAPKIIELAARKDTPDLMWVLGATVPLSSQLAEDLVRLGDQLGVYVVILDWADDDLPPLATALTMGNKRIERFLQDKTSASSFLKSALDCLVSIRAC